MARVRKGWITLLRHVVRLVTALVSLARVLGED